MVSTVGYRQGSQISVLLRKHLRKRIVVQLASPWMSHLALEPEDQRTFLPLQPCVTLTDK